MVRKRWSKNGGETFEGRLVTAAYRELPLGSVITVQNSRNGKRVDVKVNDRGPADRDRVLALSKAAFAAVEDLDKCLVICTYRKYA